MAVKLSVCPFSVLVFITTVILVTRQKRRHQLQPSVSIDPRSSINASDDDATTTTGTAVTGNTTVPFYVVFVLGPPGVGKGTQCQLLSERLPKQQKQESWMHLSAGDLLRAERAKGSTLAKEINQFIDAGQLVPSHITCQLLINAMIDAYMYSNSKKSQQQHIGGTPLTHFLIDGFPRSQSNLDAWNNMTTMNDSPTTTTEATTRQQFTYHVLFVLNYSCPEETLVGRILERGKTQSRTDDNITTIQARFRTFDQETKPILDYYQQRYNNNSSNSESSTNRDAAANVPVYTIPTDQPVEAVYQQTIQYFQLLSCEYTKRV